MLVLLVAGAAGLLLPAAASAHPTTAVVALDYRTTVDEVPVGLHALVIDGDRKLRLTVEPGLTVDVVGFGGEQFLRFTEGSVFANARSVTSLSTKVIVPRAGQAPAIGGTPVWQLVARGRSFTWHDHRLAPPLSRGETRRSWSIPLLVDGRRAGVGGTFERFSRPPLWPWLLLCAACLGVAAAGFVVGDRARVRLVVGLGAAAGVAALASVAGFSTGNGVTELAKWLELGASGALGLAAGAGLVLARRSRIVVAGAVAVLALIEGLGRLPVFLHAVVISTLPATLTRFADTVAIACGVGTLALLITQSFPDDRRTSPGRSSKSSNRERVGAGRRRGLARTR